MTMKSHVALGTAVLAAAVLTLSLFGASVPQPVPPQPVASPASAASPGGVVAERPTADNGLNDGPSATGMERIPVFR
ncbi:hypothetical protein [Azospirillum sp.]|uniref:hypothetical protein n=1 Tax=Azospirillum sp. TaxID=34012 RepID=UPI002D6BCD6A|nr:hypothetical protein [Azospirillum sp.]HYD68594.1 hypothetical protein [Azospirillum sp.]